jgi:hypothetical protein
MQFIRSLTRAVIPAAAVLLPAVSRGADYMFTDVVNSTGPLDRFHAEVINNRGTIAFIATTDPEAGETPGTTGLFTIRDGVLSQVGGFEGEVSSSFDLHINGRDELAFASGDWTSVHLHHVDAHGNVSSLASSGGTFGTIRQPIAFSESGNVFFLGNELFVAGPTTPAQPAFPSLGDVSIYEMIGVLPNDMPVYRGEHARERPLAFYKGPNAEDVVLRPSSAFDYAFAYRENAKGDRVFQGLIAIRRGFDPEYISGLYTGPNPTDLFVSSEGLMSYVIEPQLNEAGTIAFVAGLDAGGRGIFVGPDIIADRVIATGDPLFGSTVTSATFENGYMLTDVVDRLNDLGQIIFRYQLANGVSGIAVAALVPEPSALACLVGTTALFMRRRRCNGYRTAS